MGRQAIAALVGVAPINRDSRRERGQRHIAGGRHSVRRMLYMATLTARSWNPTIKAFAQRLTHAGDNTHSTAAPIYTPRRCMSVS